jgi:hypothetical protein
MFPTLNYVKIVPRTHISLLLVRQHVQLVQELSRNTHWQWVLKALVTVFVSIHLCKLS